MPELPDVEVYVTCLAPRILGQQIDRIRLLRPFVLRSVTPPLDAAGGHTVQSVARLGKRIVVGLTGDLYLVLHLMIAGRLRWRERDVAIPKKLGLGVCAAERFWDLVVVQCSRPVPQEGQTVGTAVGF